MRVAASLRNSENFPGPDVPSSGVAYLSRSSRNCATISLSRSLRQFHNRSISVTSRFTCSSPLLSLLLIVVSFLPLSPGCARWMGLAEQGIDGAAIGERIGPIADGLKYTLAGRFGRGPG